MPYPANHIELFWRAISRCLHPAKLACFLALRRQSRSRFPSTVGGNCLARSLSYLWYHNLRRAWLIRNHYHLQVSFPNDFCFGSGSKMLLEFPPATVSPSPFTLASGCLLASSSFCRTLPGQRRVARFFAAIEYQASNGSSWVAYTQ
jgi:hypothetical protein